MSQEPQVKVILFSSVADWFSEPSQAEKLKLYYGQLTGLGMLIVFVDDDLERMQADLITSLVPVPLLMTKNDITPYLESVKNDGDIPIVVGLGDPEELNLAQLDLLVIEFGSDFKESKVPHFCLKAAGAAGWREFLEEMTRTLNVIIRKRKYRPGSKLRNRKNDETEDN
jgi:hypothetical protein